jgi:putative restriction endonuclease
MVALYIANTDNNWFDFLARRHDLPEVNFWRPSAQEFHTIGPGELLVFRLKSPRNKIGGFGVLSSSSVLPLQILWDTFQEANGAATYENLRALIAALRKEPVGPATHIGCRILVQPVFLPPEAWFELPRSWAGNIVGGKRYSAEEGEGRDLWNVLQDLAHSTTLGVTTGFREAGARYGRPTLITPRLGQGAFRVAVTEAYQRKCALTGGKVLPALDAAHIQPYADGGTHVTSNGILLRKDIHSVFDAGYATFDADFRFVVSNKIRDVFNNGEEYRRLHGAKITLPLSASDRPSVEHLRWHNSEKFLE